HLVEHGGLAAVVSPVDLDEFGDEGLRRNLEDLSWLEEVARTHDAVVTQVSQSAPTAPLRLATICFGDEGVRARLAEWQEPLTAALDRIEGRVEWSVKLYDDFGTQTAPSAQSSDEPETGAAYLMRRRAENAQKA